MEKRPNKYFPVDIATTIKELSLSSPECTPAFLNKDFTAYTLEALSVLKVTPGMKKEMKVTVEDNRRRADGRRNAEFDVLVEFKDSMIDVEIQKRRRGDEIFRSAFYMGRLVTDLKKGTKLIPYRRLISLWICDFNPFEEEGLDLPYYVFQSAYRKRGNIYGYDGVFYLDNGIEYIFINGAFDWSKVEKERPLSEEEKALRTYVMDMMQVSADNIINDVAREALVECKEEGRMSYEKVRENLYYNYKDFYDDVAKEYEEKGKAEGISEGISKGIAEGKAQEKRATIKAMLSERIDIDIISKISGLSKGDILAIGKEPQ